MNVLWVTSFNEAIYEASGRELVRSFIDTDSDGLLYCGYEGFPSATLLQHHRLLLDQLDGPGITPLTHWLAEWHTYIPRDLGGTADPTCRCRGGPYEANDRRHVMPCIAAWFCRHASRWYRKIATLERAMLFVGRGIVQHYDAIVWVDADCQFLQRVTANQVEDWFAGTGVFYLKSTRPVLEAGVIGFNLQADGDRVLKRVFDLYRTGDIFKEPRWDDSWAWQQAIETFRTPSLVRSGPVESRDLAAGREIGSNARVVETSELAGFLTHDKGRHGKKLGLYR